MSVLSGPEIVRLVNQTRKARDTAAMLGGVWPPEWNGPLIDIEPFDPELAGPNSYDVHLGGTLCQYTLPYLVDAPGDPDNGTACPYLHPRRPTPTAPLGPGPWILKPGQFYLGHTRERTWCAGLVPWLDGRSSTGRQSVCIHATAGRGDDGFSGQWTLEITTTLPVLLEPGMRIGQITFLHLVGKRSPYAGRYQGQEGAVASRIHLPTTPPFPMSDHPGDPT